MPLRYNGEWHGAHWAVWEIQEEEQELWALLASASVEKERLCLIRHPHRRLQALAARAALQSLPSAPHFSLSHSYSWAAAITAPFPVAADIEQRRPFPSHVWTYFTSFAERQRLHQSYLTEWHFWCAKEVAYKILRSKYDNISFRRELTFTGEWVEFHRDSAYHILPISFIEEKEWILAIGRFE
ncbi:MAG: hypothetical protein RMK19_06510 [Bacteroidia bacterium]|nr:hypothetical protein [Bacteroidia bacterium]MDW8015646.1 hypothetical protein [Bacteroidia bacterium]